MLHNCGNNTSETDVKYIAFYRKYDYYMYDLIKVNGGSGFAK
ncbi:hypothetical protein SAMN05421578_113102 [Paenibacillus macquariensis]|uniref:Uncharacterized protein n=1 Tax=Paenibacillus macquariensis TaxID=948756 RepID=A0ABY1K8P9_9BACL|nr:hypothetical protein SAMN05421578_113102 [Paenibacillus macquariensis]